MKQLRFSNRSLVFLGLAAGVLALAGIALLVAYFFLSRQPAAPTGWVDPTTELVSERIAVDVAVLTLAGEPDDRMVRAALDAREVETAYATLAYSVLLPDNTRSGSWLLLANTYQEQDPARAAVCYQAAFDLAALGATLGDVARADVSLQVARGYADLQRDWIATLGLAQAENLARYSLTLLPAQRRNVLTQVIAVYEGLGEAQIAAALRSQIDAYAAGTGVSVQTPAQLLPTLRGAVVLPQPVVAALAARQSAAANLAARWLASGPSGRATLAQTLGQALSDEDAARSDYYAGAEGLELANRLALLHDQMTWLSIKHRVANLGYGVSLVPEWEQQGSEIGQALTQTVTELINGYGQQLDTLDSVEAVHARVELLRQGMLWSRLGLFHDQQAEAILSEQLAEASRQLWTRQGGAGLTIVAQDVQGQRFYLLAGSDSAQSTPTAAAGQ